MTQNLVISLSSDHRSQTSTACLESSKMVHYRHRYSIYKIRARNTGPKRERVNVKKRPQSDKTSYTPPVTETHIVVTIIEHIYQSQPSPTIHYTYNLSCKFACGCANSTTPCSMQNVAHIEFLRWFSQPPKWTPSSLGIHPPPQTKTWERRTGEHAYRFQGNLGHKRLPNLDAENLEVRKIPDMQIWPCMHTDLIQSWTT